MSRAAVIMWGSCVRRVCCGSECCCAREYMRVRLINAGAIAPQRCAGCATEFLERAAGGGQSVGAWRWRWCLCAWVLCVWCVVATGHRTTWLPLVVARMRIPGALTCGQPVTDRAQSPRCLSAPTTVPLTTQQTVTGARCVHEALWGGLRCIATGVCSIWPAVATGLGCDPSPPAARLSLDVHRLLRLV